MQYQSCFSPSRALPRPQQARTAGKIYRSTWKLSDKEVEAYCGIYRDVYYDNEYEALVALAEKEGEQEEEVGFDEMEWFAVLSLSPLSNMQHLTIHTRVRF